MNNTPNQTPIEPSEEAVSAATTEFFGEDGYGLRAEIEAALVIAYAIDVAPIIAERDRLKTALIALRLQALQSSDLTATEWGQEAIDLANGAIGDYPKPRAALEPKP